MLFETTIPFEPVSLKRHRHRLHGGTYDPSKKEKDDFIKAIELLPEGLPKDKMTNPIKCVLHFYCKRPKSHYKTGKNANILKDTSPKYNINNKDLDNMVKFVLDALNDKLYVDDSLIFEINCSKLYSEGDGYIYVKFAEIKDE
jgi:Holliday junction resolvase RusA-like endonuclease